MNRSPAVAVLLVLVMARAFAAAEGSDLEIGGPGEGVGQFRELRDITFDRAGNLYVLEGLRWDDQAQAWSGNGRVQKFDPAGQPLAQFDVRDEDLGRNQDPQRIAVDAQGTIHVTQPRAGLVQRFTAEGEVEMPVAIAAAMAIAAMPDGGVAVLPTRGKAIAIVDEVGEIERSVPLVNELTGVQDLTVDRQGRFIALADVHRIFVIDPAGKLVNVIGAGADTRNDDGSEPLHSVAVDSLGHIHAMTWGNPGAVLRFSPDLTSLVARNGQFKWADPWSIHSSYVPLAINPSDRLWAAASHQHAPDNVHFNFYRPVPVVLRVMTDFFEVGKFGVTQRSALALGFKPSLEIALPHGVGYDLDAPIAVDLVVAKANRRVTTAHVAWRAVDVERREVASGAFDLALTDDEEARQRIEFTPKAYGWCMVMADITSGDTVLANLARFCGTTPKYPGMVALDHSMKPATVQDPMRQAFAGLMNVRLHASNDKAHLDGLEGQIAEAEKAGCTWFVQLTDRKDCDPVAVRAIVDRLKGRVPVWEIMNEPNFSFGSPAEYVATLKAAHAIIRELDPKAKIMGPNVCGIDLGWHEGFYAAGGGVFVDILSIHDYEGHENIDPTHWRWKFARLREIMAKHGDADKPIWQTERAISGVRGENFLGGAQAVRMTLHRDLLQTLGVSPEHDNHFYCNDHGFGDCPSWVWSGSGPHPAVFATRTRYALTAGRAYTGTLDFGPSGERLFMGLRYDGADGSTYVLRNLGMAPTPLSFAISGTGPVEIVDAFGNARQEQPKAGALTIAAGQLPTYVRLAKGRELRAPRLDFGRDHADRARLRWSGTSTSDIALLTDGVLQTMHAGNPDGGTDGKSIWRGEFAAAPAAPATLDIVFDQPRPLSRLVLHGTHADNDFCALLDYDVQCRDGDGWRTIVEARTPLAPSEPALTAGAKAATWLLDDNVRWHEFAPVTTDALRLVVRRATNGFVPDDRSRAWGNLIPAKLMLREIDVHGPDATVAVSATAAQPTHTAAFAHAELSVTVANHGKKSVKATARILTPAGWSATPSEIALDLPAGKDRTAIVRLTPPADIPAGITAIDVALVDAAGTTLDYAWATLAMTAPVSATPAVPPSIDAARQQLALTVASTAAKPVSGVARLELTGPTAIAPIDQAFGPIAPGGSATVVVVVPGVDLTAGAWRARWTVRADGIVVTAADQDLSIRLWSVLGPFANDIAKDFGPETKVDFAKASIDRMGNEQRWRPLASGDNGYIDFAAAFAEHENVCAYAVAYVKATPGAATLSLGSDDGAKVWFNGAKVHEENGAHGASPGQVKIAVELREGWNEVLFKVMQGGGGWGFYCDVIDAAGKPLPDAVWTPRKP